MRRTGANTRFRESSRIDCSEAAVRIRPFGVESPRSPNHESTLFVSALKNGSEASDSNYN